MQYINLAQDQLLSYFHEPQKSEMFACCNDCDIKDKSVKLEFCFIHFSGAFGVVHRCVEKSTGRVFVAKFINTPYPLDKFTVRNEINVMNHLHHPKLLTLKDAFDDKHEMILILEL